MELIISKYVNVFDLLLNIK